MSTLPNPTRVRGAARTAAVLGLLAGIVIATMILLDPLHLTGLDERLRGLAGARPGPEQAGTLWTCPMHPSVIETEPGTCPICGMDLVPMGADQAEAAPSAPVGTSHGPAVRIDPVVQQNMNVTTEAVQRRDIRRRIRTIGFLDYDQDRMVTVTTKYSGFVEKAFVDYLGQPVLKGEPLFEVYSPELVQTQQELLSAVRYAEHLTGASPETEERARSLVAAARQRLELWDIGDDQIDGLVRRGEMVRTLEVTAPASGVVMKRMHGLEGARIEPGMDVIHIAGLDTLLLSVEVYTDQLPWIREGSTATVTLDYFPGETFTGRVRYVEPEVSESTRTVQLTLEVPNPGRRLRVGMYATVVFEPVEVRDAVTVPSQAVLRTGLRNVVVVALGDGRFAPRDVTLGREGDGYVQVLEGLEAGDTIVTSAQFLIDSESNLREAGRKMSDAMRDDAAPAAGHHH